MPDLHYTDIVLIKVMNMRPVRQYAHPEHARQSVHVYEPGAGGVHHVALRTSTEETYHSWARRLNAMGIRNSGEVDLPPFLEPRRAAIVANLKPID